MTLNDGYSLLLHVIVHLKFAVCALMKFLPAASRGLTGSFMSDTDLAWSFPMSAFVIELVDTVCVCAMVDDYIYDMDTFVIAWEVMKCIDWPVTSALPSSQFLLYVMNTEKELNLTIEGAARVIND